MKERSYHYVIYDEHNDSYLCNDDVFRHDLEGHSPETHYRQFTTRPNTLHLAYELSAVYYKMAVIKVEAADYHSRKDGKIYRGLTNMMQSLLKELDTI